MIKYEPIPSLIEKNPFSLRFVNAEWNDFIACLGNSCMYNNELMENCRKLVEYDDIMIWVKYPVSK